jgi:hypothetical protein
VHNYLRLDDFKARPGLNIAGTTDDDALRILGEHITDQFDGYTHRHFHVEKDTRYFAGNDATRILLEWDVARITSLLEDNNHDASYNITFGSSDYVTWPYSAKSTQDRDDARPITALEINLRSSGIQDIWMEGQLRYKLSGLFGYAERLRDDGVKVGASSVTAASTQFRVTNSTRVSVGDTIVVGNEHMYITARTSSEIGVIRAVNGTTGSTGHSSSTTIRRFIYPASITQAALMQASRIWTRREKGFADNAVGLQESGQAGPMVTGMDADVRQLLSQYIKRSAF